MKQGIGISKISYLMNDFSDESVERLRLAPFKSNIPSSYDSIAIMNVHNNDNSYQYNYLMYIDDAGEGHALDTISYAYYDENDIDQETGLKRKRYVNFDKLKLRESNMSTAVNKTTAEIVAGQQETLNHIMNAVSNVVNILNDEGTRVRLGLTDDGRINEAVENVTSAQVINAADDGNTFIRPGRVERT